MMVHMRLGERKLDYYALQNSFDARVNPAQSLLRRDKYGDAADLLGTEPHPLAAGEPLLNARPVPVKPATVPYKYKTGRDSEGEEDEDAAEDFAEHEYEYGEYDFRHPGTSWESDDEEERGDNEIFSPISTRAGQELGSILLVGKGGTQKPVDTAAALGSGSASLPSLPQQRPRVPRLILGSAPSRFEATRQPSSGPPYAADLRPNPRTGTSSTTTRRSAHSTRDSCRAAAAATPPPRAVGPTGACTSTSQAPDSPRRAPATSAASRAGARFRFQSSE